MAKDTSCLGASGGSVDAKFTAPTINASPCNFSFSLPSFSFGFTPPSIPFPPPIPIPSFSLSLSCDLTKPIDISAGLDFGGGRVVCRDADPDADED